VGVDISASSIILFDTLILKKIFCQVIFLIRCFLVLRFFRRKVGFLEIEIKGKIKEDLE
jgi:hypothetical protein